MANKKYKVVDLYDGIDVVGYANDRTTAKKLARMQAADTDGECYVVILVYDEQEQKYVVE